MVQPVDFRLVVGLSWWLSWSMLVKCTGGGTVDAAHKVLAPEGAVSCTLSEPQVTRCSGELPQAHDEGCEATGAPVDQRSRTRFIWAATSAR